MAISRRRFLLALLSCSLTSSPGCGLLIYPERQGQPKGQLDWGVVMLDALGLLLFLVPGVVAFIVDFGTGTIYLPPEGRVGVFRGKKGESLAKVQVPREQLSRERVEEVVSHHVGQPVQLHDGQYQTEPLKSVDEYWPTVDRIAGES